MSDAAQIELSHDSAINYAFQQNAIPVIKELRFRNDGTPRKDLLLRVSVEPAFAEPLEIRLQSVAADSEFHTDRINLKPGHDFFANLTERVAGLLKVEALEEDRLIRAISEPISLLARNEWCGLVSLPEILAAFVLPNDPAVMTILDRAAELLREHTERAAFNGYQDKSRRRVWEQAAAIYKAVAELGVRYIVPPASFESTGQKVRLPSDILGQRFGTCLDLSLLFAACCEQAGLHPLVLIHDGHAYAGLWLEKRTLPEAAGDDLQYLRKLAADELITVFESTLVTHENPGTLKDAELAARPHLLTETPFRLALDVSRARGARIRPLPVPGETPGRDLTDETAREDSTGGGIGERTFFEVADPVSNPEPAKPASRIDQWKSRLLDLSLRNRLLNFKETKSVIRILSASPESVEDELAAERELALRPKPKLMSEDDPRHAELLTEQQRADALAEHLREELAGGRLRTHLDEAEHSRRLTDLFRAARAALDENGSNTLFVVIGLLEWRETEHSDRVNRAPLLLAPVELKRKSVVEGFSLRRLDEDTRLNITLMEMLRRDFRKEIPGLEPLPEDENGVDVRRVFQIFRDAVREMPGWEVKSEVWLGQFSFTKFLLWKDLSDRLEALTGNRIVRHLIHEAGAPIANPHEDIRPAQLDDRFHPREVFCPRSADSSQLAAVMAAAAGHDFVLEGPPGTGKSQTITNIIAHCLAHGKRVLFVAEKRAALDVVHRRLREEGLEPFCLELHSNKTGKTEVLAQFDRALKFADGEGAPDWDRRAAELERLRTSLNEYTRALHRRHPCGLSAWHCLDYLLPRQEGLTVRLEDWPEPLETSQETLEEARDLARRLQDRGRAVAPPATHPLAALGCEEWSPRWADEATEGLRSLAAATRAAMEAAGEVFRWLGGPERPVTREELNQVANLLEHLRHPRPVGPGFASTPWHSLSADLDRWAALARERRELRDRLALYRETELLKLDLDFLNRKREIASHSWFLPKWLGLNSVRNVLRSVRRDGTKPEAESLEAVLGNATRLRDINAELAAADGAARNHLGRLWENGEPDGEAISRAKTWGEALHSRLRACAGEDFAWLGRMRELLTALFTEGPEAYGPDTAAGKRMERYLETLARFQAELSAVSDTLRLRRKSIENAPGHFTAVLDMVEKTLAGWPEIRRWCAWLKARNTAAAHGLEPLVEIIESAPDREIPDIPELFERGFRRVLLHAILEREPVLREFFGHEHSARVEQFRKADAKLAELTRDLICARLAAGVPREQTTAADGVPKAEIGLLRKEIAKKTRHLPVRRLLGGIRSLMPRLKPCVLMSPLSVAQYLEATHENFDVVIFDEASQIPVWDAIGAIARGRQLIVVGDPKQLPPTNFFAGNPGEDDELTAEAHQDLESILDELMTHGLRHKRLQWHYRSRQEGLITFSNRQYYQNGLLTFPAPDTGGGGVTFRHLPEARYDKGRSRTNLREAEALVAELVERLRRTDGPRRSYGVVTFSLAQQQLVENLLDEERRKHPEIEAHFGEEPPVEGEPVFVKNLESVQGDERDVILFSICYGPDESGRVSMNFGPLTKSGGERRLNVAITRAKHEVLVFSSLSAGQIDLTRTRSRGVRDLKHFLDYAERGPKALAAADDASADAEPDSEFERMVADRIRAAGYDVHHQVGCSGYRIDLGVVDPANPGRYLLGVECDGATYHRAATARDRDKLRQEILEGLGWRLHRVWSTDWWHDSGKEMETLLAVLSALTDNSPPNPSPENRTPASETNALETPA